MYKVPGTLHPDLQFSNYDIEWFRGYSDDPHNKVVAIITDEEGFILVAESNALACGYIEPTPERLARPAKYDWIMHAEANAICAAASSGHQTERRRMFVSVPPCHGCANLIIASGIARVYVPAGAATSDKWLESCARARQAFKEAGVEYIEV